MRSVIVGIAAGAIVLGGGVGCATKGYVQRQVGEVNSKVDDLSSDVEQNQERTRQNEQRIGEVDQRAGAAEGAAAAAGRSADAAGTRAGEAGAKADALERESNRLMFEVVLTSDQANFGFDAVELPDAAKAEIDELVVQLAADPQGQYIEIEGHTDSAGSHEVNQRVGLRRAEAAKRYLHEHHQVPLHKINVISYGEEKPAVPNTTRAGRAQNRRVVIRVLS